MQFWWPVLGRNPDLKHHTDPMTYLLDLNILQNVYLIYICYIYIYHILNE